MYRVEYRNKAGEAVSRTFNVQREVAEFLGSKNYIISRTLKNKSGRLYLRLLGDVRINRELPQPVIDKFKEENK